MLPAHAAAGLPEVRRLEAVSFRSWPAANTRYDGTWAIRLTAGHPAKRLNSVNPLDPADHSNIDQRIARSARAFQAFGRPLIFRQSPLAPPELDNRLDARGWRRFDETIVMTVSLQQVDLDRAIDHVPFQEIGHWIDQCIHMGSFSPSVKPGLFELISSVEGEVGLFLMEDKDGAPKAAAMAVRFGDLLGLFEIVSNPKMRRSGHGRTIMQNAMLWGREHGASRAWLQVVGNNHPAVTLYDSIGFAEVYRYAYRQAPGNYHG